MKKYKNILLDLDGTLTDPKVGITKSVANGLKHFNIKVDDLDTLCKFIGPPLKDSYMKYFGLSEADAIIAIEKYREYFSVAGIFENKLYDGTITLLETLKANDCKIILATSKPEVFATKILEHFEILKYFHFVAGSMLDGTRVDKGEVISYALNKSGVTHLSETIMIGDRQYDINGAKENNIDSIGVLYGYGSKAELETASATYIAETIEDILKILK